MASQWRPSTARGDLHHTLVYIKQYNFPVQRLYTHWPHNAGVSIRLSIGFSRRPQPDWGSITQYSHIIILYTFRILHVLHDLPGVNYTMSPLWNQLFHKCYSHKAQDTTTATILKHSNTNDQIIITWVRRFEETRRICDTIKHHTWWVMLVTK